MNNKQIVLATTAYVESHLHDSLALDQIAHEIGYSKFYLHRTFKEIVAFSLHDYIKRRRLSEASKELLTQEASVIEIALNAGYQSQQSFSDSFRKLYKTTPGRFRKKQDEFILLYPFSETCCLDFSKDYHFTMAQMEDIELILQLMKQVIGGFPYWNEKVYVKALTSSIRKNSCLIAKTEQVIAVVLLDKNQSMIDCLAIHPLFVHSSLETQLFQKVRDFFDDRNEFYTITFRSDDLLDSGYRQQLLDLGFEPVQLRKDLDYPTQLMHYSI